MSEKTESPPELEHSKAPARALVRAEAVGRFELKSAAASPLVHVPIYCSLGTEADTVIYMLELTIACVDSYFAHGNRCELLLSTNDYRVLGALSRYRANSRHHFEIAFVSQSELLSTFRTDASRLADNPCVRMIFSKFFPVLRGLAPRIVHVDFDTVFMSRLDFEPLFAGDIGLVDANRFNPAHPWYPNPTHAEFFHIGPESRPVCNWINSGVFAIQGKGFDLCRVELCYYLRNLERAISADINVYPDEIIMNALAIREPRAVAVIADHTYNFLAYFLKHDPGWLRNCRILHFHGVKPQVFRAVEDAIFHRFDEHGRVNEDFYLAVLLWLRHLHAAASALRYNMPTLERMPLDLVLREYERVSASGRGTKLAWASG